MLTGTVGIIRSGKTGLDTLLGLIEAEKPDSEVFCNYPVAHKRIKYMQTVDDFMELNFDELNGLAIVQEFQVWAESRLSGKELTRMVDKTVLQSGKLGFDILWDAQLASSVDKRIRFNTVNWFATRRKYKIDELNGWLFRYLYLSERQKIHKFNIPDWKTLKRLVLDKYDTRKLADLKRKWEIEKREGGLSDEQKKYEETGKVKIYQPNGDMIDKITPDVPDKKLNLKEVLANGEMELVA